MLGLGMGVQFPINSNNYGKKNIKKQFYWLERYSQNVSTVNLPTLVSFNGKTLTGEFIFCTQ